MKTTNLRQLFPRRRRRTPASTHPLEPLHVGPRPLSPHIRADHEDSLAREGAPVHLPDGEREELFVTPALVREVERDLPASSPAPSTPTLSLSPLERRAVGTLVADAEETMARYTAERAGAYATGRSDVRLRALARAAAREDVMAQELGALLAAAVARRDERGVQILERSLNAATQRYLRIVEQLRVESAPTRRVMMRATGSITVAAEERG